MRTRKRLLLLAARLFEGYFAGKLRSPVFIIGCARSGTTLLANALALHRDIASWSEANNIWDPHGYPWAETDPGTPPIWDDPFAHTARWWRDTQSHTRQLRAIFGAYQWTQRQPVFVNKSPFNTFRLPYLVQIFPDARYLHLTRDGRAVAFSYASKIYPEVAASPVYAKYHANYSFDELLVKLSAFWQVNLQEVARQDAALGLTQRGVLLELAYEDLCADLRGSLDRICRFIGVDPDRFRPELDQIKTPNRNSGWQNRVAPELASRMAAAMEPALSQQGYLNEKQVEKL